MHFHWQNLNDKPGNRQGSGLRHGRAWLHFSRGEIGWCWSLFILDCGARLAVTQREGVGFRGSLSVPLFGSLYWHITGVWLVASIARWLLRNAGYKDRDTSWSIHGGALYWNVWRDEWEGWDRTVPRWRHGSIDFRDVLLGRAKFSKRELKRVDVTIGMPEGAYPATVVIEERTWKRPRWFARRRLGHNVDIPKGIPFPGKGENSYDCGEDALYGQSGLGTTVEEAVARVVESVLRSRHRYGGSVNWRPSRAKAA